MFVNPSTEATRALHCGLSHWFMTHKCDLPVYTAGVPDWGTLVFEIMSQQIPVACVQSIWLGWMERWPALTDVAVASSADIIVTWANLGCLSCALCLKVCATTVVEKHDGEVPLSLKELMLLSGVGTYTASALLTFRHGI